MDAAPPVLKLPVELFRDILKQYVDDIKASYFLSPDRESQDDAAARASRLRKWYTIMHVCRSWRKIASDCPELWDVMDTSWPSAVQADFLSRSNNREVFSPSFLIHDHHCSSSSSRPSSPFAAIERRYPCKEALPTLRGLKIIITQTDYNQHIPQFWTEFSAGHLLTPSPHLQYLHLEALDSRFHMDPLMLATPEEMFGGESPPLESVVLRNFSPRFLLSRVELDNLRFLEVVYTPEHGHEVFSYEVLQILSMAYRLEIVIFNVKTYQDWAVESDMTFVERSERLTMSNLKELSLELWPSHHLEYLMSSIDTPAIHHFRTSIHPRHSPKTYNWMNVAPPQISHLASQCRSARGCYKHGRLSLSAYHSENLPDSALNVKPPIAYTYVFATDSAWRDDKTLNHISSLFFPASCTTLEISSPLEDLGDESHSVVPLLNQFPAVKNLRIESHPIVYFFTRSHILQNRLWDTITSLTLVVDQIFVAEKMMRLVHALDWKFARVRKRKFGDVNVICASDEIRENIPVGFYEQLEKLVENLEMSVRVATDGE
ncbi:hypothetical protein SISNIDRAFT_553327 [Sistotremastrum niveocremeum HHB9708]|uniref:Uncharacterized protein n=2 Tax=Sistotremastraceae TaxID=3402574 RepID=A0A164MX60_9AGAM|nr:hypothetical protein SISNIDRAFT_553327 [Sistotremastrum niveocremeum HHB9708]KZT32810.1 hypothetical protein SISSUDRAFT_1132944 [Sistotremastrum suecicum HHB10207 ss-3]